MDGNGAVHNGLFKFAPLAEHRPCRHHMANVPFNNFRDADGHRLELMLDAPHLMNDVETEPARSASEKPRTAIDWGNPPPFRWQGEATYFDGIDPKVRPRTPLRIALQITTDVLPDSARDPVPVNFHCCS